MATTMQIQNGITELYIATFNRSPDATGLAYWVSKIEDSGWSIEDVALSFFDSDEVAIKYPTTLSNEEFLNTIYNNVLGRDGDAGGMTYWLEQMEKGIEKNQMIITIINGANADTGSAADKLFLANQTEVGYYFAVTLGLQDVSEAKESLKDISTLATSVEDTKDSLDAYKHSLDTSISLIEGDSLDNNINGTDDSNYIYSYASNDVITTGTGDNVVVAGSGIDTIYANSGKDTIKGGSGADTVYAGDGDDVIYGEDGADSLHGQLGADTIHAGIGNDYLYGDEGNDYLYGGEGDDNIEGGAGDDIIYGEDGDDIINAGEGANFVNGGNGADTIYGGSSIDRIFGGLGNDTIYGLAGADFLDGLTGDDTVYAGAGNDTIYGNEGDDILYGNTGDDSIYAELGDDKIYAGAGADTLSGGEGKDTFFFKVGDSNLTTLDKITDFSFSPSGLDKLSLVAQGSAIVNLAQADVSAATSLALAADIVSISDGSTNALIGWFIYEDNTYIYEDLSAAATFQDSSDIIIQLQGIVDLQGLNTATVQFN